MEKGTQKSGLLLVGGKIATETKVIEKGYILTERNRILQIGYRKDLAMPLEATKANWHLIEVPDESLVLPGFIDLHVHGAQGADVMDGTLDALATIAKALPAEGVTSFLATTMTEREDILGKVLRTTASYMEQEYIGAEVLGLHLEGPFISPDRAGAQALEEIKEPNLELFNSWFQEAKGAIRLVTMLRK